MNVGIFTDNDFDKVNGVTTSLRAVLDHAPADLNLRVYTCASSGSDTPTYLALRSPGCGIPYYTEMKVHLPPVVRLLRQAERDRLDLIHLTTPGPVGLAALWIASRLHLPVVGSFHTHLAEYTSTLSGSKRLGALMQHYLRWSYGHCQHVLAPSEATRSLLISNHMEADRIRLWRRGVSTKRFDPRRRSESLRRQWTVSDARPALLYVGRLSHEKGLREMAAVRRFLQARRTPHRLVFVGDGPMRSELEQLCPEAVFTGTLQPNDVAVAMASSDLFVFPSRTDTAGNVVLEAQACGLPVLVTDEGGPRENVRTGDSGVVCASTRDFCRATLELCANEARRRRMGDAAREYALTRRWETALQPLYDTYREVAGSLALRSTQSSAGVAAA